MVESEVSEPDICSDDMGAGLNLETPEEIERIQNEAQAKDSQPQPVEPTTNKKKGREVSAPVWAHFKKGEKQEDGSYTATCIYCGHVYDMGNQKGTGNMTNHIARGCKKVPPAKRRKRDALQKLLQAGIDADGQQTVTLWEFDQMKCRKSFARCVVAHEYPFNCTSHYFFKVFLSDVCPSFKIPSRRTLSMTV